MITLAFKIQAMTHPETQDKSSNFLGIILSCSEILYVRGIQMLMCNSVYTLILFEICNATNE